MTQNPIQTFVRHALQCAVFLFALASCANLGTPNGGPYDEKPPIFLGSTPEQHATNVKSTNITLEFDELIQIDNPSENVIITPPQINMPVIRAAGRNAVIELKDTLIPNTTYTIDFTTALADNNEKNIYENFVFAFSTGDVIDSLEVAGTLLNAENLEPMPGITIGLHSNLHDTAFVKTQFLRTSKTNDRGQFTIRNIAHGTYRLYALNDVNRDYKFDQPGEDIAFLDSLIIPTFEFSTRQDTLWKDTLTIDTVTTVPFTDFKPDNLVLMLFKENFTRQYLKKSERIQDKQFALQFAAKPDTMPQIRPLNFSPSSAQWYTVRTEEAGLTLSYWITDSTIYKQDSLTIELNHAVSDSLNTLQPKTDTITLVAKRERTRERKKNNDSEEPQKLPMLEINFSKSGTMEVYDTMRISFPTPPVDVEKNKIKLMQQVDTLWTEADYELLQDSLDAFAYIIKRKWGYNEKYSINIDSATISDAYGLHNDSVGHTFSTAAEDTYGHLYLAVQKTDTLPSYIELLDSSDKPVRKQKVENGGALFMNLKPAKYYARIIIDANNNYEWDTGKYATKQQAEQVYYFNKEMEIMKNWQVEESWDIGATPITRQKPLNITENKPKEVTKQKRDHRAESNAQQNSNSSSGMGGLGL